MILCLSVKLILSTVLVLSGQCYSQRSNETDIKTINVILMAPYPDLDPLGRPATFEDGHEITPAAYLAVEQINNRTDILKEYKLELIRKDEGCNITERAIDSFARYIYYRTTPVAGIIGLTCIESSEVIADLTTSERAGIVSLAYFELPTFRNYTNAFGIIRTIFNHSNLFFKLMVENNWKRVAVLYSKNNIGFYQLRDKVQSSPIGNHEIVFSGILSSDFFPLEELRHSYARVVFVFATPGFYSRLFCLAYHKNMTHPNYQWIIAYAYFQFFETSFNYSGVNYHCSVEQIHEAIEGSLLFVPDFTSIDPDKVVTSGLNLTQFRSLYVDQVEEYANTYNVSSTPSDWGVPAYDATWALALALNSSLDELEERNITFSEKDLGRQQEITEIIRRHMLDVEFDGFTGHINFNTTECPVNQSKTTILTQYMENGRRIPIGTYQFGKLNLKATFLNYNMLEYIYHRSSESESLSIFFIPTGIALLATVPAHIINIVYRNHKLIKASSHKLNHIIFVGCYLEILGITLYTVGQTQVLSQTAHSVLCNLFAIFGNVGFILILATTCVKTWRLYNIFKGERIPKKKFWLKDRVLVLIIGLLVSVEVVVFIVWMVIAPFRASIKLGSSSQTDILNGDTLTTVVSSQIISISCKSDWFSPCITTLILYKGVILFLSLVFAILSRNIHRKEFETKNIIFLVYLVSSLFVIVFPLYVIFSLQRKQTVLPFLILNTGLILMVYIYLAVLFLPPIVREIYRTHRHKFPCSKTHSLNKQPTEKYTVPVPKEVKLQ